MKASNSQNKMDVIVTKTSWKNGKKWVKVKLKNSRSFFPSFEDLHRIVQAICYCEDEKYPDGEGRLMVARFLYDSCFTEDFSEIAKEYNIPIRQGYEIIDDNKTNINAL